MCETSPYLQYGTLQPSRLHPLTYSPSHPLPSTDTDTHTDTHRHPIVLYTLLVDKLYLRYDYCTDTVVPYYYKYITTTTALYNTGPSLLLLPLRCCYLYLNYNVHSPFVFLSNLPLFSHLLHLSLHHHSFTFIPSTLPIYSPHTPTHTHIHTPQNLTIIDTHVSSTKIHKLLSSRVGGRVNE